LYNNCSGRGGAWVHSMLHVCSKVKTVNSSYLFHGQLSTVFGEAASFAYPSLTKLDSRRSCHQARRVRSGQKTPSLGRRRVLFGRFFFLFFISFPLPGPG
jgi:hypothetical protein